MNNMTADDMTAAAIPSGPAVRYLKLGRSGGWEHECLAHGIARFGTHSEEPHRYLAAVEGRYADLRSTFLADGRGPAKATQFANDTMAFFAQDEVLWVTFSAQRLWWGYFEPGWPAQHEDGHGTFRRIRGGWHSDDARGNDLRMERLAGSPTKSAAYRGTMFQFDAQTSAYILRRINGEAPDEVIRSRAAVASVRESVVELLGLLEPRDFELLVDLVFTGSGWRRITELGRTQKTLDLIVELPSTREQAWIQVKSTATPEVLEESAAQFEALGYPRLFFVHHGGEVGKARHPGVTVIGPSQLADLVVDGGLVHWLIEKVA